MPCICHCLPRERGIIVDDTRGNIARRIKIFDRAVWRKSSKYTWSGLIILVVGIVVMIIGLGLRTGAYSAEGLLVGLGAIIALVGIIRLLIGFINPAIPEDLPPVEKPEEGEEEMVDSILPQGPEGDRI